MTEPTYIPVEQCIPRGIYEIRARNFSVGIFTSGKEEGRQGFIGIRQKFDNRYLFTEYHYDTGGGVGTAMPIRLLGMVENPHIQLWERYPGTICGYCGESVEFREELKGAFDPLSQDYTSWPWVHVTTAGCSARPDPWGRSTYHPLFQLLEEYGDQLMREREQEAPECGGGR